MTLLRLLVAAVLVATVVGCGTSPSAPTPAPTPAPTATPASTPTPSPSPTTLRSAAFTGANGYNTSGSARIVQAGASFRLELLSDFRTDNSNALDVRLCTSSSCSSGSHLSVAALMRTSGAQDYALAGDGTGYAFVVIWCRAVNLPFGAGKLE